MLTNVSVYWLTGTATSSARLYKEGRASWGQQTERSEVPSGVAVFPGDFGIRAIAERDNNVVHWSEFERGGHFPAMEVPDLWSAMCARSSAASADPADGHAPT